MISDSSAIVAWQVTFSGRVQGVGFRYTAQRLASGFAVGGWVKNLPTGQVELWVEGVENQVAQFLERLAREMSGYIEQTGSEGRIPQGYDGFRVTY